MSTSKLPLKEVDPNTGHINSRLSRNRSADQLQAQYSKKNETQPSQASVPVDAVFGASGDRAVELTKPLSEAQENAQGPHESNGGFEAEMYSGVSNMLRNTTETGDIGQFPAPSRFYKPYKSQRPLKRPFQGSPRLPTAISGYTTSRIPLSVLGGYGASRTSSHYSHTGSMRSGASQWSGRDDPGGPLNTFDGSFPRTPGFPERLDPTERSYSLTPRLPSHTPGLVYHRSMTSLRSQGYPARPHSPYTSSNRFVRPGYRPASPALSDTGYYGTKFRNRPAMPPSAYSVSPAYPHSLTAGQPGLIPRAYSFDQDMADGELNPSGNQQFHPLQQVSTGFALPEAPTLAAVPSNSLQRSTQGYDIGKNEQSPALANGSVHHDSASPLDVAPYRGFVQHVKHVLEERMVSGNGAHVVSNSAAPARNNKVFADYNGDRYHLDTIPDQTTATGVQIVEKVNTTPASLNHDNVGQISTGNAPAHEGEETVATTIMSDKRLTRELIRAGVGASSDTDVASDTHGELNAASFVEINDEEHDELEIGRTAEAPAKLDVSTTDSSTSAALEDSSGARETATSDTHSLPYSASPEPFSTRGIQKSHKSEHIATNSYPRDSQAEEHYENARRPFSAPSQRWRQQTQDLPAQSSPLFASEHGIEVNNPTAHQTQNVLQDRESSMPQSTRRNTGPQSSVTDNAARHSIESDASTRRIIACYDDGNYNSTPQYANNESEAAWEGYNENSSARNSALDPRHFAFGFPWYNHIPTNGRSFGGATPDFRATVVRSFHLPLPDLTEDSLEDASATNLRILGAKPTVLKPESVPMPRESVVEQPTSYLGRSLSDTRQIPSFHFSRVDLTTKLNVALGIRLSRSMDDLRLGSSVQKLATESSSSMKDARRSAYQSFFVSVSGSGTEEDTIEKDGSSADQRLTRHEELMSEIRELSIPSVSNLTVRLSEFLPSLRRSLSQLDLAKVEEALQQEHSKLCSADGADQSLAKLEGVSSKRESKGKGRKKYEKFCFDKDLPPLPRDALEHAGAPVSSLMPQGLRVTRKKNDTGELQDIDAKYADTAESIANNHVDVEPEKPRHAKASKARGSDDELGVGARTQKWFRDKSVSIDFGPEDRLRVVRSMSPGLHGQVNVIPSDMDSIPDSRSFQVAGSSPQDGSSPGFVLNPRFLHPEQRIVGTGDRYPTTSLTPPVAVTIDEDRSFFSDDTSHHSTRRRSLRNRLNRMRVRRTPTRSQLYLSGAQPLASWERLGSSRLGRDPVNAAASEVQAEPAPVGLSKTEVRFRRLMGRLRMLWVKSGRLVSRVAGLRSKKRRHARVRPATMAVWGGDVDARVDELEA